MEDSPNQKSSSSWLGTWWHRTSLSDIQIKLELLGKNLWKRLSKYSKLREYLTRVFPYEAFPLWVASILTGILAVAYEKLFEWTEHAVSSIFSASSWYIFLLAPVGMTFSWWLIHKTTKSAGGSGIPQLMVAVELADTKKSGFTDYFLNLRVILIKILSSISMLLGGGAIGREGPTLQIAGSIFQLVHRLIPKEWPKIKHKNMLITGGASGLAAAFNTPLGGIVYVVEELTKSHIGKFRSAVFAAVIISGLTAQLFLGSYLYLGFPKLASLPSWGILLVIVFAFISGIAGAGFSKILLILDAFRKGIASFRNQFVWAFLLSICFAALVYFSGKYAMGTGKLVLNDILFSAEKMPWYLFPVRVLACIISFAVGGAGGIFATSLASGASLGEILYQLISVPKEFKNLLVLVSMIGFLTGVTRSPFTAAILVLEMTDRHSAIFYFLLAGQVSNLAASLLMKHSFYDYQRLEFLKKIDELYKNQKKKSRGTED